MALLVGAIAPASAQEPRKKIVVGSQIGYPLYAMVNNVGEVDGFSVKALSVVRGRIGKVEIIVAKQHLKRAVIFHLL